MIFLVYLFNGSLVVHASEMVVGLAGPVVGWWGVVRRYYDTLSQEGHLMMLGAG